MLRTDLPDHRRASEDELVAALRARDALALAEAYHRTIPAAHAVARRMLSGTAEVEALLRAVYAEMWATPPADIPLEGWTRNRTFELAAADLRERNAAPASPSTASLLADLPKPEVRYLDAAERGLAELAEPQRRALLLAHDQGLPTDSQPSEHAAADLEAALIALAGPDAAEDLGVCRIDGLVDWVLGLVPVDRATEIATSVAADQACAARLKALRRGRRRLEGLPPTPDMGHRVLVVVLAGMPAPAPVAASHGGAAGLASALDADVVFTPPAAADDDTGDLTAAAQAARTSAVGGGPRPDPYAELAELDAAAPAVVGEPADESTPTPTQPPAFQGEQAPGGSRGAGGRVLTWLLGILFMIGGVALGLYLGVTLMPRLIDALR